MGIKMTEEKIITLYDEKGKSEEYEMIDIFELDGNTYYGFSELPKKKIFSFFYREIPVVMLKSVSTGFGEEILIEIEDKAEEERAFIELLRLVD
jgi:hypothetical protein